jgi:molybdenum cofactor biosynthesis enzyme MoaA
MSPKKNTTKKKAKIAKSKKVSKPVKKVKRIRRIPKRVPDSKAFWLKSDHGKIVGIAHDTKELAAHLNKSRISVFNFHVSPGRNDFAHWIEDALGDKALGDKVSKCKNKKSLLKLLNS